MSDIDKYRMPYPGIGEVVRSFSLIIDLKPYGTDIDRYAREEKLDFYLQERFISEICDEISNFLNTDFSITVRQYLFETIDVYTELIKSFPLTGYSRKQSIPFLCETIIIPATAHFLRSWSTDHTEINYHQILASDTPVSESFKVLFCYIDLTEFKEKLDKADRKQFNDKLGRWIKGSTLPNFQSLNLLLDEVFSKMHLKERDQISLRELFFIARAVQSLYLKLNHLNLRNRFIKYIDQGDSPSIDKLVFHSRRILDENLDSEPGEIMELMTPLLQLINEITEQLAKTGKTSEDKRKIDLLLKRAEGQCKTLKKSNPPLCPVYRLRAKWRIFSGDLEGGLKLYNKIFKILFSTGHEYFDKVFEECIVIAAVNEDRVLLKQIKNQGIAFNILSKPINIKNSVANIKSKTKDCIIEDWELDSWKNKLNYYFHQSLYFPDTVFSTGTDNKLPFLTMSEDELNLKPDYRYPNRNIKLFDKRKIYPQIVWFTSQGKYKIVSELLKRGADVNQLTSSGESALLFAIQFMSKTLYPKPDHYQSESDSDLFDLLHQHDHFTEIVNTPTDKKKLTPLGCAIETGRPDIVQKVLDMGADVNLKSNIGMVYPLYMIINYSNPRYSEGLLNTLKSNPNQELLEVMRRSSPGLYGITNTNYSEVFNRIKQKISDEYFNSLASGVDHKRELPFKEKTCLQISEILLRKGADPNQKHRRNERLWNFTPLMLAAEFDLLSVSKLLIDYGGDPNLNCKYKSTPVNMNEASTWDIALNWGSQSVLNYLTENKMKFRN